MRALVTGAAGFIGSHLCEHLLAHGDDVVGVDAFTPFYERARKESNLAEAAGEAQFRFVEADLLHTDVAALLDGVDVVYHLAAEPGVRRSWHAADHYWRMNVTATRRLLGAARRTRPAKFVFASSSSVYGDAVRLPADEGTPPSPLSPYGVTKLAAERLCEAARVDDGVPCVSLRLFTVYGPRQRPDMAIARLISAALERRPFDLYGDGEQTRDFTYVADVVAAMRLAATSGWAGVANVAGGSRVSLKEVVAAIEATCGPIDLRAHPPQRGDASHTAADVSLARAAFGWSPAYDLVRGVEEMVEWARRRLAQPAPAMTGDSDTRSVG